MISAILSRRTIFTSASLRPQQLTIPFTPPPRRLAFQTDINSRLTVARWRWNHEFKGMP